MDSPTLSTVSFEEELKQYIPNCKHGNKMGFCGDCSAEKREAPKKEVVEIKPKKIFHPPDLPKKYAQCTLDNFDGNLNLIAAIREAIENRESMVLTGKTGCGKTHLAAALAKEIPTEEKYPQDQLFIPGTVFITAPELLLKARSCFRESAATTEEQIINHYSKCELLVLDDLGAEKTTEYSITTLYPIIARCWLPRNCSDRQSTP